jgi:serine/threonine-protein kinase
VTGQTPFRGETIVDLITAKEKGTFTPARRVNHDVPERLDLMIDKAMARDPQHRYQSCDELIRDLESLNLAGPSLSFIAPAEKGAAGRGGVSVSRAGSSVPAAARTGIAPGSSRVLGRSSAQDAAGTQAPQAGGDVKWFVRHTDQTTGRIKVSQWHTAQVLKAIKSDVLDVKAQAARDAKGPFLPLAQIREFESEARKLAARSSSKSRDQNLAAQYAQIEKQYNRQKWWRLLARFREGTLGLVGFILYLAAVAALLGLAGWGVWIGWQYLGAKLGL